MKNKAIVEQSVPLINSYTSKDYIEMLDYIIVRGDAHFGQRHSISEFNKRLSWKLELEKKGNCSFLVELEGATFCIQGILADENGCYGFTSDYEFNEINLVEICYPIEKEGSFYGEIEELTFSVAELLGWEVYDPSEEEILTRG